jgi:1-deoxy-D-xylulose-5-phosphate synthase
MTVTTGLFDTVTDDRDLRAEVRALPTTELPALAEEIRRFLVEKVSQSGGHLGPNLGVVELTIALHRVFRSPRDLIVFDTGHQSYVHKMLTGRRAAFDTLRQQDGLSGYPARAESVHDHVENSHASTALSYADGLAKARQLSGDWAGKVVAVVGDGALTGGMCWEALNNIGGAARPVIVVLNDNARSYSPTTGALASHLRRLRTERGDNLCGNLFNELGFAYLGPVDGHDVVAVEQELWKATILGRPSVVHVVTVKGKGYPPAEQDEVDHLHAVGVINPTTGRPPAKSAPTWTSVFAEEIAALGAERPDLVCVTAAMLHPTGLAPFAARFPDRVVDVGIAEQHAVASAAGLAMGGRHPVVAIYSAFLSRAFDQVLADVALHRLPVTFVLDRAGVTGPDGPSHHGMWDASILGVVPGLRLAAPRDPGRLRELMREAVDHDGPTAIRYPKATAAADIPAVARMNGIDVLHRSRSMPLDVLLVATGSTAGVALDAASRLSVDNIGSTVVDPRWVLPVNPVLPALAARHQLLVTVEDNTRAGGIGAAIGQACQDAGVSTPVVNLGLPHAFVPHGPRKGLLAEAGLDVDGITRAVRAALDRRTPPAQRTGSIS